MASPFLARKKVGVYGSWRCVGMLFSGRTERNLHSIYTKKRSRTFSGAAQEKKIQFRRPLRLFSWEIVRRAGRKKKISTNSTTEDVRRERKRSFFLCAADRGQFFGEKKGKKCLHFRLLFWSQRTPAAGTAATCNAAFHFY